MAVIFVGIGILIASNLDLSAPAQADVPLNIAQTGAFPIVQNDQGEHESPFVGVVEKVTNAVVNISARTRNADDLPWWHQGSNFASSSGSGFFFRDDGYILTNNHVVQNARKIDVTTSTGYKYEATLVGADPETDLAVLKVEPEEDIVTIPFGDSDNLKVGDWAIAIGNPFPQQGLDRTVTVGVISAMGRSNLRFGRETPQYQYYIQTDASINPGNSGGPLLNLKGEVIGINAAISSPTGTSVGIGFAIPINMARAIVPDLIESGRAHRGWLGVWLANVTEREAKRQGLDAVRGVRIDSVFANSPAQQAGIKSGDIIVGFNRQPVDNSSQLMVLVSTVRSGKDVPVEIVRDAKPMTLWTQVTDRDAFLAGVDDSPGAVQQEDFSSETFYGMELVEFTEDIARALSMEHIDGLYVRRVYPGTPADDASITKGTVLLDINNSPVKSLTDARMIEKQLEGRRETVPLIVQEPDGTIARKVIRP
jgi:Do/DeqQ family serine protease